MLTLSPLLSTFQPDKTDMAAFTSALDRRRQDYQILRSGLTFPRPLSSASLTSAPLSSSSAASISIPLISSASSASSGTLASGVGTGTAAGAGTMSTGGTKEEKTKSEGEGETINPVFEEFWPEVKDKLLTLEDCHLLVRLPKSPFNPLHKSRISNESSLTLCLCPCLCLTPPFFCCRFGWATSTFEWTSLMGKYGNWWRTRIGLGCLFGIRFVCFFNLLLCLLPGRIRRRRIFADKRTFVGKFHLKMK